jgi:hypothetical protein
MHTISYCSKIIHLSCFKDISRIRDTDTDVDTDVYTDVVIRTYTDVEGTLRRGRGRGRWRGRCVWARVLPVFCQGIASEGSLGMHTIKWLAFDATG